MKKVISIYTDGAYNFSTGIGAWAFIVLVDNEEDFFDSGVVSNTTSNRMEVFALIKALQYVFIKYGIKDIDHLKIYSDSAYLINMINYWIYMWDNRGWRTSVNKPVKNIDLVKLLYNMLCSPYSLVKYQGYHVGRNSGNKYNEICDMMAKDALAYELDKINK